DGYAIGGLSVGETTEEACEVLESLQEILPADRPRYFMGGAQPHELIEYVKRGIDMFDCVLPTRNARHGQLYRFVHEDFSRPDFYEQIQITNEKWKLSSEPLIRDPGYSEADKELSRYSMGYLRHLFTVDEMLAYRLATMVNVRFYLKLFSLIREKITQELI
ncbi:MAG TPA: tRNA-guanine transglycosylase, partial [Patescibacteria group bacterium]|nr:tRNA-guanine transglycosylase [Patescibacteria group bacterium]